MIDIKLIRENPKLVKANIKKKFQNDKLKLVDEVKELDNKWRRLKYDEDKFRAGRNKVSIGISEAKKSKDQKKAKELMKKAKEIPQKIAKIQEKRKKLEVEIKEIMYKIPNIIHESVPIGKGEKENVELKKIGKPAVSKYKIFNHAQLAEKLGGVDFNSAKETSGSGFYYLTGDLAMLHSAILAFARDYMIKQGFEYVLPPFLIRENVLTGVYSTKEINQMAYKIEGEDLFLIATSEHPMIGRFMGKVISSSKIPVTLTSYSPCFRKEVGAHGIEEKGFYRVHQFEKQEMIVICEPEESYKWYDKMLKFTIDVFKQLGLPIRVLECCSGDLADLKAKSCDVEAWSPRQKIYFEVGSLTNMESAQARRLDIRVNNGKERYFAHTLNNTVIASPRVLISIMENNQNKDGSINIPKVLQPYMLGKKKIEIKK